MKKLASLLLALVMIMSCFSAMAGEVTTPETGSITINDAVVGQTYTIYQILDLESYNASVGAYAYKATSAWANFINGTTVNGVFVTVDAQGYVTWKEGVAESEAANFAKLAQAYAKDNNLTPAKEAVTATTTTVEFTGLDLGYYLVDTTLGTLCSLDTTNPNVEMYEKNVEPTIEKLVQEDDGGEWAEKNTAEIGDTVYFKTTVHAKYGAQNYVVHDKMSEGLTYNAVTAVKVGETTLTAGTDYDVVTNDICAECDFHVVFTQTYLNAIAADTDIVIEYNATLNSQAVISTGANTNDTMLNYGDNSTTQWDHTDTYTFKFDLVKTTKDNKVLNGAQFELYDAPTDGNKIALVKEEDGTYRVATDEEINAKDEEGKSTFESAIIEAGEATIEGLDANTKYYLQEVTAPAGYNKLSARVEVAIGEANLNATVVDQVYDKGGVQVINQTGAELPSTGGMGTTLLYVGGGILVLAAIVLLIAKRRTSAE